MQFSVVIPLYNKANYVQRAIKSVLAQSIQDFELLVVNDGSTDASVERAKSLEGAKVKVFNKANGGSASARNFGIAKSSGTIICFLDADDYWEPHFLSQIKTLAHTFPKAGLLANAYGFEKNNKRYLPKYYGLPNETNVFTVPNYFESVLYGAQIATASSCAIPKHILNQFGGFNEQMRYTEDQELWNRIAMQYPVVMCRKLAAIYKQDATGMKTNRVPKQQIEYAQYLEQDLKAGKVPKVYETVVRKIIAANLIGVAALNILAGDKKTAKNFLQDQRTKHLPERRKKWQRMYFLPSFLAKALYKLKSK